MKRLRMMILPVFLVLLFGTAAAQDGFVVMSMKGKVEARKPGRRAAWVAVKVGDVLGKDYSVRTSFASYVKLMMGKSRLLSIDEETTKKLRNNFV